jgi:enoyl-CoA hydratase/carnithine racemase
VFDVIAESLPALRHSGIRRSSSAPPRCSPRFKWIVGLGVARELCLTGRRIDAAEALRVGLVTRVTESDDLLDEALAMARSIIEAPQVALEPQSAI